MKKVCFYNKDGLWEEYTIRSAVDALGVSKNGNKANKYVIMHYQQYQVCRFDTVAFRCKMFNSETSASNYLLQYLNRLLENGEVFQLVIS